MKKFIICICSFISLLVIVMSIIILLYLSGIKAVSKSNKEIEFLVEKGSNYYSIASSLKSEGLIKSELWYKVYLKLNKAPLIKQGVHKLKKNMSVKEIIKELSKNGYDPNALNLTFKEGFNFYDLIDIITTNTNNTEEDIINLLNNEEYINNLINDYWFITDEIKNEKIYYKLEGYLYPDTYQFKEDVKVEEIFKELLKQMDKKLSEYKDKIEENQYSVHQILTLASIIELEGVNKEDRGNIAGVFYNRLNNNMSLGSDVTTYYAERIDNWSRDLKKSELNECNKYNTRSSCMAGKLPVGPICNPGIKSIEATIEPSNHKYYYFVADKNGKTYFNKTDSEHTKTVSRLKRDGLWIEYED